MHSYSKILLFSCFGSLQLLRALDQAATSMALKLFWLWVPPAVGSHRSSCCYLCDSSAVLNPLSCWEPLFKLLLSKAFESPQRLKALIQAAAIYGSSAVLSLSSFWEPSFKQLSKALKLFWIPSAVGREPSFKLLLSMALRHSYQRPRGRLHGSQSSAVSS